MTKRHRNKRGVSAWLLIWDGVGRESAWHGKIAAVLSPRLSAERVKEIVTVLYATSIHSLIDQIEWAKKPNNNPDEAQYGSLKGIRWTGQIFCGDNPMLEARLVDELRSENGIVHWQERTKPQIPTTFTSSSRVDREGQRR